MIFIREASARSPEVTFRRVSAGQRGISISRWFLCMQIGAGPDRLLEDAFTHRGDAGRDVDVCTRSRSPSAADPLRGLDGDSPEPPRVGPGPEVGPGWVASGPRGEPRGGPGGGSGGSGGSGTGLRPAQTDRASATHPDADRTRSTAVRPLHPEPGPKRPRVSFRGPPPPHPGNRPPLTPETCSRPTPGTHSPLIPEDRSRPVPGPAPDPPPEAARTRPRRGADAARTWRGRGPGTVRTRSGRGANATPAAIPPQSVRGSHTGRDDRGDRSVTSATSAAGAQEEGLANRFNRW